MSGLVQAADVAALEPPAKPRGFVREVLLGQRVALVGLAILIAFTLIAVAAPWIEPDSTTQQAGAVYAAPTAKHLLGLDDGGIDMLSEVIAGARVSMLVGFSAAAVAML
ncbi:MAG: ABC transporter permease, partial [Gaiellales bacterium]